MVTLVVFFFVLRAFETATFAIRMGVIFELEDSLVSLYSAQFIEMVLHVELQLLVLHMLLASGFGVGQHHQH